MNHQSKLQQIYLYTIFSCCVVFLVYYLLENTVIFGKKFIWHETSLLIFLCNSYLKLFSTQDKFNEVLSGTHIGLYVRCLLFLSNLDKTHFSRTLQYRISQTIQQEESYSMRTDIHDAKSHFVKVLWTCLKINNKHCGTRNDHILGCMQVTKLSKTDYLLRYSLTINKWIIVVKPFKHIT